ncbi:hypothetical protein ALP99_102768 [Pseudomonas syringae pv. tomato]|uniref:Uncharacterized protein n=1 Tax=Pseudomonas syringae pv. tomato TaxID=323 RepID=A0AAQ0SMR3_PSEUB|nr:hypothetical protein NB04_28270 [Pseudomonas syringae pv. tomato]KUR47664.1 hypothetical protein PSTA9_01517 [Pseudomonas syringae pv. tomato]KUR48069.1 hypothetical protein PST407_02328 [Pseudomonas syringae pv. tomato]RMQ73651.1 hypothetical protein ALQ00_102688 [Pseudomonas syringae pv. tomato]RMQ79141.1 hypothetical protein ALP99_102768 [Pseudomonas syringae pv. tomato]
MASEIGQIPVTGGDFLRFLLAIRSAVESAKTGKHAVALEVANDDRWSAIVDKLGGAQSVAMRLARSRPG